MRTLWPVVLLLGVAGCASERVTLLPDENGKVGVIAVTGSAGRELILNKAYAAAQTDQGDVRFRQSSEAEVNDRYKATLSAIPQAARSYVLHFVIEKTELLPESKQVVSEILADYRRRPAPEMIIIGHTDKSGDAKYNEDLSHRRAAAVRKLLISAGVDPERVEMAWRGAREPLPGTAGRIFEQSNRRVEVKVR
jgi:outer membrane protein OmpA-like peptidoglycan-associated protein